jgi:hypothetical protein
MLCPFFFRPQTADGRPQMGRWTDDRPQTAGGRPLQDGLFSLSGLQTVNEWGVNTVNEWGNESTNQTADRRRQTAAGRAFQPVGVADRQRMGGEYRQRMGERINESDRGPQTADRCRTGFPARRGCKPSTNGERINECGRRMAGWTMDGVRAQIVGRAFQPVGVADRQRMGGETNKRMETADGRLRMGRWTVDRGRW